MLFPKVSVTNVDFYGSDHRAISLSMNPLCDVQFRNGPKRFAFEQKWIVENDFSSVIEQWKVCGLHVDLPNKLLQFSGVLKSWVGSRFSEFPKKIQVLRANLQGLLHSSKVKNNFTRINIVEHEIESLFCIVLLLSALISKSDANSTIFNLTNSINITPFVVLSVRPP